MGNISIAILLIALAVIGAWLFGKYQIRKDSNRLPYNHKVKK